MGMNNNNVKLLSSNVTDIVFQNATTATGNGTPLPVGGRKTVTFEVFATGTSPTFTVNFEGSAASGTYYPVNATNLATMTNATSATAAGLFQVDLTGLVNFRVRLSAIGGTTPAVTAQGKVVA